MGRLIRSDDVGLGQEVRMGIITKISSGVVGKVSWFLMLDRSGSTFLFFTLPKLNSILAESVGVQGVLFLPLLYLAGDGLHPLPPLDVDSSVILQFLQLQLLSFLEVHLHPFLQSALNLLFCPLLHPFFLL